MAEYIEREAIQKRLNRIVEVNNLRTDRAWFTPYGVNALIEEIPAVDVRPVVRGKWIDRDNDYYGWNMWACSACGEEFVLTEGTPDMNDYHFCPNCGADMR